MVCGGEEGSGRFRPAFLARGTFVFESFAPAVNTSLPRYNSDYRYVEKPSTTTMNLLLLASSLLGV